MLWAKSLCAENDTSKCGGMMEILLSAGLVTRAGYVLTFGHSRATTCDSLEVPLREKSPGGAVAGAVLSAASSCMWFSHLV